MVQEIDHIMTMRDKLVKEMFLRLGGQMVDVEADPEHYDLAIDKALAKFRQRSENAVQESFIPLRLITDQSEYTLSSDVIEVYDIYRRSSGVSGTSSNDFEPFEAQYLNTYLYNSGRAGGLAVYDALAQQRESLGRLFGAEYTFTWNTVTHKLLIHRRIRSDDDVYLHVFKQRSEDELLTDPYAKPWLSDYSFAQLRLMLAEARGKFAQVAGPQGGTSLNADALRADAQADLEKLEEDLRLYTEGSSGLGFVIG